MSTPDVTAPVPTNAAGSATDREFRWSPRQALRDSAYLFAGWWVHLLGFVAFAVLMSGGLSMLFVLVGIPLVLGGLGVAHVMTDAERSMQRHLLDRALPDAPTAAETGWSIKRVWEALKDPRRNRFSTP
ncbi:sensor domain-containing protein [Dermacoccus abyssi]|uniref:sensor domain-containing protein n=1 Tax=Dermacoccus TaxID=57495 RepID=UPI0013EBF270|nr:MULTISPECIES: sensor domain-containing protein [Dermacoccus]MCT1987829.1 sensor domain-containing protein [Dermacoccus abyssi]